MIVALRFTDEHASRVIELRVTRIGGRRGQLWERQAAGDEFVFLGSGYGFAAVRRFARHRGLTNEVVA